MWSLCFFQMKFVMKLFTDSWFFKSELFSVIIHTVESAFISFMGVSVFVQSGNVEVLKGFSFSFVSWLNFLLVEIVGSAYKFWFDVYCWGMALIFFLQASTEFTHSSGLGF